MQEQEGVIKFRFDHQNRPIDQAISLSSLNAWRSILFKLGLIGKDPARYGGLGYGNISLKPDLNSNKFIISGTQTGHIEELSREHYCEVWNIDIERYFLQSKGLTKPSSEAITHACVYSQDVSIRSVIHIHSPEIWQKTAELALPHTPADAAYGTPQMARAVAELFQSGRLDDRPVFSMLGHQDGIVAFGDSIEHAGWLLIKALGDALRIEDMIDKQ
ncbi:class II aldolase/adducin family protein [Methylotuvimicrobium alcaliphilum]|uniref:Ribulose-5-phosphate 4-epimerase n=1 Tax=Methylotuvimicrobium alcaliphilum (strain DSM 19304 / NCIMB 14124 / VKM B-2133 / 20Z) TaxID=1091494 RepID=G4T0X6_META2|nr:class II aldolase/adducin family protein [Methylotuvimicrobium alcaliphilum]CCE23410.1 Ribulose-5-phosphate 4-epimerase [Methylotuvimicrobium alcaliphilum 20Z]